MSDWTQIHAVTLLKGARRGNEWNATAKRPNQNRTVKTAVEALASIVESMKRAHIHGRMKRIVMLVVVVTKSKTTPQILANTKADKAGNKRSFDPDSLSRSGRKSLHLLASSL